MASIETFTFNPLQENTYVVYDETKECIIIDPGCYEKHEKEELSEFITQKGLKPVKLLNTHCHVDHVLGNYFIQKRYNLKAETSKVEESQLRSVKLYAPVYGFHAFEESEVGAYLEEGDVVEFGNTTLRVLFVPGHSPGHLAFYNAMDGWCVAGDVLFRASIGRYDLPGGDYHQLETSIKSKLYVLPENTVIYPGHGPKTTIGNEKQSNPFVRGV